jgi:hypothetical protein
VRWSELIFFKKIIEGVYRLNFCLTDNITEQKFLRRLNFQKKLRAGGKIETPCLLPDFTLSDCRRVLTKKK